MQREKITIGSFVHVYNRGNKKQEIVKDNKDRWRFLDTIYYLNDEFLGANILRKAEKALLTSDVNRVFSRPGIWPERRPLVKILSYSLLNNHYHFLLKEIRDGGISLFMKRLGTSVSKYFNARYKEDGKLFQGSYKMKVVDSQAYLKYLSVYIQVKNIFEMYPGGYEKAVNEFNRAYDWGVGHPFSSLADFAGERTSPIIDKDILAELFSNSEEYKEFARQCLERGDLSDRLGKLTID